MSFLKQGDVVPYISHPDHVSESGPIRNGHATLAFSAVPLETVGLLVKAKSGGAWPVAAASEHASVVGVVVTDKAIAELAAVTNTVDDYCVIVRDAMVDLDKLPATDPWGAAWSKTNLQTRFEAIGWSVRRSA